MLARLVHAAAESTLSVLARRASFAEDHWAVPTLDGAAVVAMSAQSRALDRDPSVACDDCPRRVPADGQVHRGPRGCTPEWHRERAHRRPS